MDEKLSKKKLGLGLGAGTLAVLFGLDPDKFLTYFSVAIQHQITINLIAFSVAAWIHSGRVKKEFTSVTGAINNLGDALRADLKSLGNRLGTVEGEVVKIKTKLGDL